jgi:shikimate kinase
LIVEFAGCPGSGKTTLAGEVAALLNHFPVRAELAPGSSLRQSAANLGMALRGILPVLFDRDSRDATTLVWSSSVDRSTNNYRVARTLSGIRRLGRQRAMLERATEIHLVDEGVTGLLQLAFAGGKEPQLDDVAALCHALPAPDLIVYLHAPIEELVRRHYERRDAPREWRHLEPTEVCRRMTLVQSMLDAAMEASCFPAVVRLESPLVADEAKSVARAVATSIEELWRARG